MRLAALALCLASAASAAPYHVPLHVPPRLTPKGDSAVFGVSAGWLAARGPGLAVQGPGGGWELAGAVKDRGSAHLRADAFALSGDIEPTLGRRRAVGMTGALEAVLKWRPRGPDSALSVYGGGQLGMGSLSVGAPRAVVIDGRQKFEPDSVFSFTVGAPAGVMLEGAAGRVPFSLALYGLVTAGGFEVFTYTSALAGTRLLGSTRGVDARLSGGARLRVETPVRRAGLEAGAMAATASGRHDPVSVLTAALTLRLGH